MAKKVSEEDFYDWKVNSWFLIIILVKNFTTISINRYFQSSLLIIKTFYASILYFYSNISFHIMWKFVNTCYFSSLISDKNLSLVFHLFDDVGS